MKIEKAKTIISEASPEVKLVLFALSRANKAADDFAEALCHYGEHWPKCSIYTENGSCDCGFACAKDAAVLHLKFAAMRDAASSEPH